MNEQDFLLIQGKKVEAERFLLALKRCANVGALFLNAGVSFEKNLRVNALKKVYSHSVEAYKEDHAELADELTYRIGLFEILGEYQLQNLLNIFPDEELVKQYLFDLFTSIFSLLDSKKIDYSFVNTDILSSRKDWGSTYQKVDASLDPIFVDKLPTDFDGIENLIIRPVLYNGSKNDELRKLGLKYGIKVPKNLKKSELIEQIVSYKKEYTTEEKELLSDQLDKKPMILIERYAKDNNIKISSTLKKEEIIEYILKHLDKYAPFYKLPKSRKDYFFTEEQKITYGLVHVLAPEDEEEVVEEVVTPVKEETVEETVKEETVKEETKEPQTVRNDERVVEKETITRELVREIQGNTYYSSTNEVVKEYIVEKPVEVIVEKEVIKEVVVEKNIYAGEKIVYRQPLPLKYKGLKIFLVILLLLELAALGLIIYFLFF